MVGCGNKRMTFSKFADIVTVISGLMTILGVSGVVSWGFFARGGSQLARSIVTAFAYSIKTAVAGLLLGPAYWMWFEIHTFTLVLLNGSLHMAFLYWDAERPLSYVAAYAVSLAIVVPIFLVAVTCIYKSSMAPVKQLFAALRGKSAP